MNNESFDDVTRYLASLPGIGRRSARRIVLHLLDRKDETMRPLAQSLLHAADHIQNCSTCYALDTISPCAICTSPVRDKTKICIVETVSDLWAIERTGSYKGLYHVLGGTLSALDGINSDDLHIPELIARLNSPDVTELIIALNATIQGQTTAHYISDILKHHDIQITRLARGVPIGSTLDYLDDNTLVTALNARSNLG